MVHLLLAVIYLSFVSLGLPDALLGSVWPMMHAELSVPVSYAGGISMIIAGGTILSSLRSDWLTSRFGPGKVTAVSVAMTAAALLGFSVSGSYWQLCLWAVPYGLGAGSVDASLNNYVALHYASRHMSWLHCMWGLGASLGPYIMSFVLGGGGHWTAGYRCIAALQAALTAVLVFSLPLWRAQPGADHVREKKSLTLFEIFAIPGVKEVLVAFFCYCALEQTAMLWASSYLVLEVGLTQQAAAGYAGLFCLGITAGRGVSGFLTMKFEDAAMIRLGSCVIGIGVAALLFPLGSGAKLVGLVLVGLGCAPVYPCIIHATPGHFGAERSQGVIGVQMASAYVGSCLMPSLFGLLADHIGVGLFPLYLGVTLVLMATMHEKLQKKARGDSI